MNIRVKSIFVNFTWILILLELILLKFLVCVKIFYIAHGINLAILSKIDKNSTLFEF